MSKFKQTPTAFPTTRLRRLRRSPGLRALVRETHLTKSDFMFPIFVRHGKNIQKEIQSMPGQFQWSIDRLPRLAEEIFELGVGSVILFGIPAEKDSIGKENFSNNGIVQQAIRMFKSTVPELLVATDVCMCEYTDHGHCGMLNSENPKLPEGYVLNDPTLDILSRTAVSHARAGVDILAPSGMMDGMVQAIRRGLDQEGFSHLPILSYAVKYASSYYGPFRDAAESPPSFGDRKSHQMDPANVREAQREAGLDIAEGADMLMVKPALPYLDVIRTLRDSYPEIPLAAYNVSGEYAMIKAAVKNGWLDEKGVVLETLLGIKRAGADLIITYHALEASKWLSE